MSDTRQQQLFAWLETLHLAPNSELISVSGDASFRRYFRYLHADKWYIAVDAPPPQETLQPFMAIAKRYAEEGLAVPEVHAYDEVVGFMVLDDLGDTLLFAQLTSDEAAHALYQRALAVLPAIMRVTETEQGPLPLYNRALLQREVDLFSEWLLIRHLALELTPSQLRTWHEACEILIESALQQPQVGVHRDFHSRNIMCVERSQHANSLALIDFQDAVKGPVTYDAVSLLRDCYVDWPQNIVDDCQAFLFQRLKTEGIIEATCDPAIFRQWFDLMGIQRHLKAAGIFARLLQRDSKPGYMADVPRTLNYIIEVSARYPELTEFYHLMRDIVQPALAKKHL